MTDITPSELMVTVAARELRDGESCLVGVGIPNLAANLAKRLHAPNLIMVYESGTRVRFGSDRITSSPTISSALRITFFAANAASFCSPIIPQMCAFPIVSARWTWTTATSGFRGGTTETSSPE